MLKTRRLGEDVVILKNRQKHQTDSLTNIKQRIIMSSSWKAAEKNKHTYTNIYLGSRKSRYESDSQNCYK